VDVRAVDIQVVDIRAVPVDSQTVLVDIRADPVDSQADPVDIQDVPVVDSHVDRLPLLEDIPAESKLLQLQRQPHHCM